MGEQKYGIDGKDWLNMPNKSKKYTRWVYKSVSSLVAVISSAD